VILPQASGFALDRSRQPIGVERVDARVEIVEQAARTTLDIGIYNPSGRQAEAVLLLPVPEGAAVSHFAFEGGAAEPTARLLPREEARRIYDEIVARIKDPALLEFAGLNLIRSSVFPVPAGGRQRLRLTYEHVLAADGNRVDYALPRSESLALRAPWHVSLDVRSKAPISMIYSPSHELVWSRHGRLDPRVGCWSSSTPEARDGAHLPVGSQIGDCSPDLQEIHLGREDRKVDHVLGIGGIGPAEHLVAVQGQQVVVGLGGEVLHDRLHEDRRVGHPLGLIHAHEAGREGGGGGQQQGGDDQDADDDLDQREPPPTSPAAGHPPGVAFPHSSPNAGLLTYGRSFMQPRGLKTEAKIGAGEGHIAL